MAKCDVCGRYVDMPYNCSHCGGTHCPEHRLPENHNCPGLQRWNDPDGVFDSGFDDSVDNRSGSRNVTDRLPIDTGAGGPLGYFRNNVSYLFLGLIVVVFGIQYIIAPLFGVRPPSPGEPLTAANLRWYNVFTVNTVNPEYVWTWVISVFSHGSPMHLLFNAIVLYFFGPIVERQVGSKKFAALFVGSGVIAGLAQVVLSLLLGTTTFVLGASGAILALLGVLAITAPDLKVLLFFVLPISMRTLAIGYAALSVFGIAAQGSVLGNVAHMAHLAGLLIGLWYGNRIKNRVGRGPKQLNIGPGGGGGGPGRRFP